MLTTLTFLPVFGGLVILLRPQHERWVRWTGLMTAAAAAVLSAWLAVPFFSQASLPALQERAPWIPTVGAEYALVLDGLSLPLVLLTTLLTLISLWYSPHASARGFVFLLLLMETGLLGVFLASDLLLFYVFWEVALVPLYFIIGIWGYERRREAALKFFLYTRAGSLALLLSVLALYLQTEPRSFGLAALQAAGHAAPPTFAALVLLGFAIGFGVKLPIVPLHSWLPDAHVEAPTAGSVMLAGVLLKMGGYGFLRIALPLVPEPFARFAVIFALIAVIDVVYGAAVALAQHDFKRLVAFTSVNHMGFVLLGATVAAVASSDANRVLAMNGAVLQMVSHGLLTGGMFLLAGMVQERAGTREFSRLGGALASQPWLAAFLIVFAFGSFGLPTMSGFVAEFQVFVAALSVYPWAAVLVAVGVAISTGLYLYALQRILFGGGASALTGKADLNWRERVALGTLFTFVLLIGITPGPVVAVINRGVQLLSQR